MVQLAIAAGVTALATGLFLAPLSAQLDDQAMRRALAIAQTTAAESRLDDALESSHPTRHGPVQNEAERIRAATGAEYVVIMDKRGVRWSHTDPDEIGRHVSTDPSAVLSGQEVMQIDEGTLGRSARGKVPLRDEQGKIVGAVSVGIAYESVRERLLSTVPQLLAYAGGALAVGALAAYIVSRRLQRRTHDLAFSDISALLAEREAMLHGIREGFLALDKHGRIRLMNDEAQRLLELRAEDTGRPLDTVLPPGRTTDVLAGRVSGADLLAVSGHRVLVANRMPTEDGGAVITLRDRTELERLGRELDGTRGLIDALRAQDHEHANRLHTLLGLLELGLHEEAVEFVTHAVGVHRATAEQVTERIHDPLLAALLVGKATVATERGASLRISPIRMCPTDWSIRTASSPCSAISSTTPWMPRRVNATHSWKPRFAPLTGPPSCGSVTTDRACQKHVAPRSSPRAGQPRIRPPMGSAASAWRSYGVSPSDMEAAPKSASAPVVVRSSP